jgi:hypothetical protein
MSSSVDQSSIHPLPANFRELWYKEELAALIADLVSAGSTIICLFLLGSKVCSRAPLESVDELDRENNECGHRR